MKKLFVHWKLMVISLTIFLIAGLSSYFYFGHLQHELDKTTQSVQSTAIQAMEKKEKQQKKTNSSQSTESNSTDGSQNSEVKISDPKKQPDYVGKDVKPLTVEAMKKVNAEKVVSTFGAGMIQILSINMNLSILEGISQENLSVGAGTMKTNQELGKGNFSLAGHYMTNAGLLFGGIKSVKKMIQYKLLIKIKLWISR